MDGNNNVLADSTIDVTTKGCYTTISSGNGNNNITGIANWTKENSPYCVESDVTISGSLAIQAGAIVRFASGTGITVQSSGLLIIEGTGSEPALLTSKETVPTPGDWDGIIYEEGCQATVFDANFQYESGSLVKHAIIEYAGPAINSLVSLNIEYSAIRHNENSTASSHGGGLKFVLDTEAVVIRYSNLNNNKISAADGRGGSVHIEGVFNSTDILLEKNIIEASESTLRVGGGIRIDNGTKTCNIKDSLFVSNKAYMGGGAISIFGNCVIENNIFTKNHAYGNGGYGGGAILSSEGNFTVKNNIFKQNTSDNSAGALKIAYNNNLIKNNVFVENSAKTIGGALYTGYSSIGSTISYNTFVNNKSTESDGGAICNGMPSSYMISYNHIMNNTAFDEGGAFFIIDHTGSLSINHNNIYQNTSNGTHTNIYNLDLDSQTADSNYWGGNNISKDTMGICDASNTGGGCDSSAGTIDVTNSKTTAWPLCLDYPNDSECVGSTLSY